MNGEVFPEREDDAEDKDVELETRPAASGWQWPSGRVRRSFWNRSRHGDLSVAATLLAAVLTVVTRETEI